MSSNKYTNLYVDKLYYNSLDPPVSGGGGSGTVTSVGLSMPGEFSVSGSPVTTTGSLSAAWVNESGNKVLASPSGGGSGAPSFRSLVDADLPSSGVVTVNTAAGELTGGAALGPGDSTTLGLSDVVVGGSFTSANITIDSKGRVTAASNGGGGGGSATEILSSDTANFLTTQTGAGNPHLSNAPISVTSDGSPSNVNGSFITKDSIATPVIFVGRTGDRPAPGTILITDGLTNAYSQGDPAVFYQVRDDVQPGYPNYLANVSAATFKEFGTNIGNVPFLQIYFDTIVISGDGAASFQFFLNAPIAFADLVDVITWDRPTGPSRMWSGFLYDMVSKVPVWAEATRISERVVQVDLPVVTNGMILKGEIRFWWGWTQNVPRPF